MLTQLEATILAPTHQVIYMTNFRGLWKDLIGSTNCKVLLCYHVHTVADQ